MLKDILIPKLKGLLTKKTKLRPKYSSLPQSGSSGGVKKKTRFKKPERWLVLATHAAMGILLSMILGVFAVLFIFLYFSRELPSPDQLLERGDELSTKLYDRNGQPLSEVYGQKNRSLIKYEDVSEHLVHATLAVEDSNFYNHQGFYLLGMLRAVKNTATGQGLQGGSTLTQQVVKNAVLTQDRTITRKIKELSLALQLENKYTKEQILQMYLNETPYGGQNYGALTAAKAYFNKLPKDLTVAEAAYMAGLPQSPSRYSYFGSDPEAGLERKNYVLYLMNERGWIGPDGKRYYLNDEEYETAKNEEISFVPGSVHFEAPHFVFYVRQTLADLLGDEALEQGGLQVTTTLDLEFQNKVQDIVTEEVEEAAYLNVGNGALVAVDPKNGQILAMVGSKDYFGESSPEGCTPGIPGEGGCVFDPNVNVATSLRQPGSSIKPITYASMLEQGYTAGFPFLDVLTKFPGSAPDKPYIPENYDGIFRGPVSLRTSLANSLNIPAVKALSIVGVDSMLDMAESMGISTLTDRQRYGLALTLGGGETKLVEMAGAYSVFANKGVLVKPFPIIEVKNASGNVIYKHNPVGERVTSEETAFIISDILSDDNARSLVFGTGSLLNIAGHDVAVKTGTTDDLRDNYAVGYTPSVVIGVWVGNNNNAEMSNVASGITGASPIWNRAMTTFLNAHEKEEFQKPSNVEKVLVDSLTGGLPFEDFSKRHEYFVKGTEPSAPSDWYQKYEVCEVDGKLASDSCKDADKTDVKAYIDVRAEVSEWQPYVDAWIGENFNGKPEYFPPRMTSALEFDEDGDVREESNPKIEIVNFDDGDKVPLSFRLEVEVSSPTDVRHVNIYLDGNKVTEDKSEPFGYNFDFKSDQRGFHEFEAVVENDRGNKDSTKIRLEVTSF